MHFPLVPQSRHLPLPVHWWHNLQSYFISITGYVQLQFPPAGAPPPDGLAFTFNVHVPVLPLILVTVIVVVPAPFVVTSPVVVFIGAIFVLLLVHVKFALFALYGVYVLFIVPFVPSVNSLSSQLTLSTPSNTSILHIALCPHSNVALQGYQMCRYLYPIA